MCVKLVRCVDPPPARHRRLCRPAPPPSAWRLYASRPAATIGRWLVGWTRRPRRCRLRSGGGCP